MPDIFQNNTAEAFEKAYPEEAAKIRESVDYRLPDLSGPENPYDAPRADHSIMGAEWDRWAATQPSQGGVNPWQYANELGSRFSGGGGLNGMDLYYLRSLKAAGALDEVALNYGKYMNPELAANDPQAAREIFYRDLRSAAERSGKTAEIENILGHNFNPEATATAIVENIEKGNLHAARRIAENATLTDFERSELEDAVKRERARLDQAQELITGQDGLIQGKKDKPDQTDDKLHLSGLYEAINTMSRDQIELLDRRIRSDSAFQQNYRRWLREHRIDKDGVADRLQDSTPFSLKEVVEFGLDKDDKNRKFLVKQIQEGFNPERFAGAITEGFNSDYVGSNFKFIGGFINHILGSLQNGGGTGKILNDEEFLLNLHRGFRYPGDQQKLDQIESSYSAWSDAYQQLAALSNEVDPAPEHDLNALADRLITLTTDGSGPSQEERVAEVSVILSTLSESERERVAKLYNERIYQRYHQIEDQLKQNPNNDQLKSQLAALQYGEAENSGTPTFYSNLAALAGEQSDSLANLHFDKEQVARALVTVTDEQARREALALLTSEQRKQVFDVIKKKKDRSYMADLGEQLGNSDYIAISQLRDQARTGMGRTGFAEQPSLDALLTTPGRNGYRSSTRQRLSGRDPVQSFITALNNQDYPALLQALGSLRSAEERSNFRAAIQEASGKPAEELFRNLPQAVKLRAMDLIENGYNPDKDLVQLEAFLNSNNFELAYTYIASWTPELRARMNQSWKARHNGQSLLDYLKELNNTLESGSQTNEYLLKSVDLLKEQPNMSFRIPAGHAVDPAVRQFAERVADELMQEPEYADLDREGFIEAFPYLLEYARTLNAENSIGQGKIPDDVLAYAIAINMVESHFRGGAVNSQSGAAGRGQLMPGSAMALYRKYTREFLSAGLDSFDIEVDLQRPDWNAALSVAHLMDDYLVTHDWQTAVAAYHAGIDAVRVAPGVYRIPDTDDGNIHTRDYVNKVERAKRAAQRVLERVNSIPPA